MVDQAGNMPGLARAWAGAGIQPGASRTHPCNKVVDRADLGTLALELRIGFGREPGPDAVRLEGGLF